MKPTRRDRQTGVAALELAAVLGFAVALLTGVIELSRAVQQFATLASSARAAARLAAASPDRDGIARARCLAVYGRAVSNCETSATPVLAGLSTAQVKILLPVDLRDASGNLLLAATPGLSTIQARAADGTAAGTLDILTVTIGPADAPVRFVPLLPGVVPAFAFAPVSVTMATSAN